MTSLRSTPARTRRRAPRRDKPPALRTMVLGLVVVSVLSAAGFVMLRVYNGVPTVDYETVFVSMPTVGNLLPHDAVRIGGTRVGQVIGLDLGADDKPRIELQLRPGTRLPADTKVGVRANGLLGARYVELKPGDSRRLLATGATIKAGESAYTYGLPEAVAVFSEKPRAGLRKILRNLGQGMLGNGVPLNTSLEKLGTTSGKFTVLAREILRRPGAAARLLPALESGLAPLERNRSTSGAFMQSTGDAVRPLVTEREALRAAIATSPAALSAADNGLRRGRALLRAVRALSIEADRTLPRAPAGLTEVSALLREAERPLRRADPTVRRLLPPTAIHARKALLATEPVLPRVRSGIDTARPILGYVGRYKCDVVNAAAVLRSMTGFAQPGSGPNGSPMAFRLQSAPGAGLEAVGIDDPTTPIKRAAYEPPCAYVSRPYPQLAPTPRRATRGASR